MQVSSSGAITTTGVISGSNALSASFSLNSALLNGTGSVGFATTGSLLTVSSSQQQISASLLQVSASQQQLSSSFLTLTASFNAVSSSQQQISASYIALSASYNVFSGSASTRITANSSSIQQVSSSQQQISSSLLNVISIFATTGSNSFRETQSITGSLTVTGQIIAQTLNVQQVTSSIIYSSGSNNFGCDLNSRQTFTGSVLITGSFTLAGAITATQSTNGEHALSVINTNNGTSAAAVFNLQNDTNSSQIVYTSSTYTGVYGCGANAINIINRNSGPINFLTAGYSNAAIRMAITNCGIVGIGYISPVADDGNLVVAGAIGTGQGAANTVAQINIWETTSGNKSGLWFGSMTNANTGIIGSRTATGNIAFQTYCGGWAERMRIDYNGNVGIGTVTPGAKLEISSPRNSTLLRLTAVSGESWDFKNCNAVGSTDVLSIGAAGATANLNLMDNGNVGIGCSLPTYHLEVRCAASTACCYLTAMFARSTGANDGIGDIIAFGANGVSSIAGMYRTAGSWGLELQTANQNTRMRIDNSGISCFSCQVCMPATAVISGGGNTLTLKKSTGSPAIALAGTSDEASLLIEGISGGGMQWYTAPGCTLSNATWSSKFNINGSGVATFACRICAPSATITTVNATTLTIGNIGHYQNYLNTSGCFAIFCASQGAVLYVTSMHNNGRSTAIVNYANGVTGGASYSVVNQITPYGPAALGFGVCANGWLYGYAQYGGPMDFYAISIGSTFVWNF